jgi:hypothetical protein
MDRKQKQQGKRKVGEPTIDQFHTILQQLCPNQNVELTEKAVAGLRQAYIAHLQQVASSLAQWDSLKDEQIVVDALASIHHSDVVAEHKWIQQAQSLLTSQQTKRPEKVQRKRRPAITAEMQAEQERLLKKSKETVLDQQQQNK